MKTATRFRAATIALLAAALALAGCGPAKDDAKTPATGGSSGATPTESGSPALAVPPVTIKPIDVDASLRAGNPAVSFAGAAVDATSGTGLLAALSSDGSGPGRAAFWSSSGGDWAEASIGQVPTGPLASLAVADGVIAGTSLSEAGAPTNFALTSADAKTWTEVDLPAEATAYRVRGAAGGRGSVYLLATDGQGGAGVIAIKGTEAAWHDLPASDISPARSYPAFAADGDRVVVGVTQTSASGQTKISVASSTDGGATWQWAGVAEGTNLVLSGASLDADAFVLSGGAVPAKAENATTVPALWSSADGAAWQQGESPALTPADVALGEYGGDQTFLGDPLGATGGLVGSTSSPGLVVVTRDSASGAWRKASPTLLVDTTYPRAQLLGGKGHDVAVANDGELTVWRTDGKAWTKALSAGKASGDTTLYSLQGAKDVAIGLGNRVALTIKSATNWTSNYTSVPFELSGLTLAPATWQGVDLGKLSNPAVAIDPGSGSQLLVARDANDYQSGDMVTFTRTGSGAWQQAGTIKAAGYTWSPRPAWDGTRWVVAYSVSGADGTTSSFGFAASADAKTWTALKGDRGEAFQANASALCPLSQGKTLAVGSSQASNTDPSEPRAFVLDAASATAVPTPALSVFAGPIGMCASGPKGVVLASTDGTSLAMTSDGTSFDPLTVPDGAYIASLTAVPGGYAAGGSLNSDAAVAPAVWLSADGTNWQAVPLTDAMAPFGSVSVTGDGADLVALSSGGRQAWRISDLAKAVTS